MKARDWFLVTFTFFVGVFCGVYLYVTAYQPNYKSDESTGTALASDFNVIGFAYGTRVSESSFRLQEDGSYTYIADESNIDERESGELPQSLFNAVSRAIAASDLDAMAAPVERDDCDSFTDQGDFEYDIEYEGESYTLDTCLTDFAKDSNLAEALAAVWRYLANPDDPEAANFTISNSPGGLDTPDSDAAREYGSGWTLRGYFERGFQESGFQD